MAVLAWPSRWNDDFNGWGRLALLPYVLLLPPVFGLASTAFRAFATTEGGVSKSLQLAVAKIALLAPCAIVISFVQRDTSFAAIEGVSMNSPRMATLLICSLFLVTFGGVSIIQEFSPRAMGEFESSFDHNLRWEAQTAELIWRDWFEPGSWWRLRPVALSALRAYGFWAFVWLLKNVAATSVLLPTTFTAHVCTPPPLQSLLLPEPK